MAVSRLCLKLPTMGGAMSTQYMHHPGAATFKGIR